MSGKDNKKYKGWRGTIAAALQKHPDKFSKEACNKKGTGKLCPYAVFTKKKEEGDTPHYKEQPKTTSGKPKKKEKFKEWLERNHEEFLDEGWGQNTVAGLGAAASMFGGSNADAANPNQFRQPVPIVRQHQEFQPVPLYVTLEFKTSGDAEVDVKSANRSFTNGVFAQKLKEAVIKALDDKGIDPETRQYKFVGMKSAIPGPDDKPYKKSIDMSDLTYGGKTVGDIAATDEKNGQKILMNYVKNNEIRTVSVPLLVTVNIFKLSK